jgi:hypothetical protein
MATILRDLVLVVVLVIVLEDVRVVLGQQEALYVNLVGIKY